MVAFVCFLWFGSIYLSARHGIHWPWLVLICLTLAGAARDDLDNDSYLP